MAYDPKKKLTLEQLEAAIIKIDERLSSLEELAESARTLLNSVINNIERYE